MAERTKSPISLFGFPFRVRPMYVFIVAMLGLPGESEFNQVFFRDLFVWFAVVTLSIVWHELGHAFAMRRFGYSATIELHGFGGRTFWVSGERTEAPTPMQRFWVSVAGPLSGFALGAMVLAIYLGVGETQIPAVDRAINLGLFVNFGWGALNLLPMVPWDGGHALHALLDRFTLGRGLVPTAITTIVVSIASGVAAWFAFHELWPVLLCVFSLVSGVAMLRARRAAAAQPRGRELPPAEHVEVAARLLAAIEPRRLVSAVLLQQSVRGDWPQLATRLTDGVAPRLRDAGERARCLELGAWAHLLGGHPSGALEAAQAMRPSHDPSPVLEALIEARMRRFDEALEAAEAIDEPELRRRIEAYSNAFASRLDAALEVIGDDHRAGALVDLCLFRQERFDDAADLAERLFERFEAPEEAYNAACSHTRAGRVERGLEWLERAIEAGFDDAGQLDADTDLEELRASEGYAAVRARLSV